MADVLRKMMTTYINTGTSGSPVWNLVGYKVEEAMIEMNPEIEKITDILGITHSDVMKLEPQMSIEGYRVEKGNVLGDELYELYRTGDYDGFSQYEVMNVFGWMENGTAPNITFDAELHKGCTIEVESIGGSTRVEMPFIIHLSNNKTLGTANVVVGTIAVPIVFTPSV